MCACQLPQPHIPVAHTQNVAPIPDDGALAKHASTGMRPFILSLLFSFIQPTGVCDPLPYPGVNQVVAWWHGQDCHTRRCDHPLPVLLFRSFPLVPSRAFFILTNCEPALKPQAPAKPRQDNTYILNFIHT